MRKKRDDKKKQLKKNKNYEDIKEDISSKLKTIKEANREIALKKARDKEKVLEIENSSYKNRFEKPEDYIRELYYVNNYDIPYLQNRFNCSAHFANKVLKLWLEEDESNVIKYNLFLNKKNESFLDIKEINKEELVNLENNFDDFKRKNIKEREAILEGMKSELTFKKMLLINKNIEFCDNIFEFSKNFSECLLKIQKYRMERNLTPADRAEMNRLENLIESINKLMGKSNLNINNILERMIDAN